MCQPWAALLKEKTKFFKKTSKHKISVVKIEEGCAFIALLKQQCSLFCCCCIRQISNCVYSTQLLCVSFSAMRHFLCVILILFVTSSLNNSSVQDDVFVKRCYCSCHYSITVPRYSGKYLCRRIPHASNGSFNPYVITNKHAHIINGNFFH